MIWTPLPLAPPVSGLVSDAGECGLSGALGAVARLVDGLEVVGVVSEFWVMRPGFDVVNAGRVVGVGVACVPVDGLPADAAPATVVSVAGADGVGESSPAAVGAVAHRLWL